MVMQPDGSRDIEYADDSRPDGGDEAGRSPGGNASTGRHRRLKVAAAALFAVCAIALLIRVGCAPARHQLDHTAEAERLKRDARVLAAAVRESGSYKAVLLLTRPKRSSGYVQELVDAARKGLRQGFGEGIEIAGADAPEFTEEVAMRASGKPLKDLPDLSKWLPPIGYWFDGEVLADAAEAHPECGLIVSMVGLPQTSGLAAVLDTPVAQGDTFPHLAILKGPLPSPTDARRLFERETLIAAVVQGSCWASVYPEKADSEFQSEFQSSRTLLTLENWEKALQVCPGLLNQPSDLDE